MKLDPLDLCQENYVKKAVSMNVKFWLQIWRRKYTAVERFGQSYDVRNLTL